MSANPPVNHRLEELLKEGSTDLEAALAESTDLDERLAAVLEEGASQLTRALQVGQTTASRSPMSATPSANALPDSDWLLGLATGACGSGYECGQPLGDCCAGAARNEARWNQAAQPSGRYVYFVH